MVFSFWKILKKYIDFIFKLVVVFNL